MKNKMKGKGRRDGGSISDVLLLISLLLAGLSSSLELLDTSKQD